MNPFPSGWSASRKAGGLALLFWALFAALTAGLAAESPRSFSIPSGDASATLSQFARQSGTQIVFLPKKVAGIRTNLVQGEMAPREALGIMLTGTGLQPVRDDATGLLTVEIEASPRIAPAAPASRTSASKSAAERVEQVAPARVVMNPFELVEDRDRSFASSGVGSAGRLQLQLQDTPVAYAVINRAFIEALDITDLREAASWATGQTYYSSDNGGDAFGRPSQYFSRGNLTSQGGAASFGAQRNFYQNSEVVADSYAVETYEFGRGPNAALFGQGSGVGGDAGNGGLGGVASTRTKQARFDAEALVLRLSLGQWGLRRAAVDYNAPLGERIAIRVNAVTSDDRGWRLLDRARMRGLTGGVTMHLSPTTDFRLEASSERSESHNVGSGWDEFVSGWDGRTVFRGPVTNAMYSTTGVTGAVAAGNSQVFGVNPVTGAVGLTYSGAPNGVDRIAAPRFQYDPYAGTVMNYQFFPVSRRADDTSRTPLWTATAPNGAYFVRGTNVDPANPRLGTDVPFGIGRSFHVKDGLPADLFERAIANSRFRIPGEQFEASIDHPTSTQAARDVQLTLSQRVGRVFLELGGDANSNVSQTSPWDNPMQPGTGGRTATLDLDMVRPDGSPNPGFLDAFVAPPLTRTVTLTRDRVIRANLGFLQDLGDWGNYAVNLNASAAERLFRSDGLNYSLRDPGLNADRRAWGTQLVRELLYASDRVRAYKEPASLAFTDVDWTVPENPVVQPRRSVRPGWVPVNWSETVFRSQAALAQVTAKWFGNRLALTGAYRRDFVKGVSRLAPFGAVGGAVSPDLPATWDGTSRVFRPAAPVDYYALSYVQRSPDGSPVTGKPLPATTRPRTTVGGVANVAVAAYSGDRFRDDFNPPAARNHESTGSAGLLVRLPLGISPYVNYGNTYTPLAGDSLDLNGALRLPSRAAGLDVGASVQLLGGKLSLRYNYFDNVRKNDAFNPTVMESINQLYQSNRFDDFDATDSGRNQRGLADLPGGDYQRRRNVGFELEAVANPAKGWRVFLNGSGSTFELADRAPLTREYISRHADQFRQVLEDAGGALDTSRRPDGAPGAPGLAVAAGADSLPSGAPLRDQAMAVNAYNNIWIQATTLVTERPSRVPNQPTLNFYSDYLVQAGPLKSLRVGAGIQWQGRVALQNLQNQTILDPSRPTPYAIDDPRVDQSDFRFMKGSYATQLNLGYSFSTRAQDEVEVSLRINNFLNDRSVVVGDAGVFSGVGGFGVFRQPDGDLTKPNRTSFPDLVSRFTEPINFRLTTSIRFKSRR